LVLDYGFREGAEEAFVSLVRSICGELSAAGITELSVFTSAGSRGRDTLASLAKRIEPYRVRTPIPEPADAANHGVYVDQLYF
jgi:hypothetical protein